MKCCGIIKSDPARRMIVVSAPGRSDADPCKVTDLLIDSYAQLCFDDDATSLGKVIRRFHKLSQSLNIDMTAEIERTREEILINRCSYDFVVSRGEYLMAILLSKILGFKFVDAAHLVVIKPSGKPDMDATTARFAKLDTRTGHVIPGFYGTSSTCPSPIRAFDRGGSDFSGAIAAVALKADMYENFTDQYGVRTANPTVVDGTQNVAHLDYTTLHKLSLAGASVIFPSCLPLLAKHNIPMTIDNSFDPGVRYTTVTAKKSTKPTFSVTYQTKNNINKDMTEIFTVWRHINFTPNDLRNLLLRHTYYLSEFNQQAKGGDFTLLTTTDNFAHIVNDIHTLFITSASLASTPSQSIAAT